ncbi:hypothetical protein Gpo141_00006112 [Globisporangium polare]
MNHDKQHSSPFPDFALSNANVEQLQELARALAWKFVHEREKLRAYISRIKDRKETSRTSTVSSGKSRKSVIATASGCDSSSASPQQPPLDGLAVMLAVGTVVGKMEDMMYGTMNHTADTSRIKISCVEDTESGVVVLATLAALTLEQPFDSFTINRLGNSRKCHACWEYVCSSCKIKKRLSHIHAQTDKLSRRELPFCSACIYAAVTTSSFTVAQQEIAATTAVSGASEGFARSGDVDFFATSSSDDLSDQS